MSPLQTGFGVSPDHSIRDVLGCCARGAGPGRRGDATVSQLAARGHRPRGGDRAVDVAGRAVNCGFAAASILPAAKCCIACSYVFGGWAAGVVVVVLGRRRRALARSGRRCDGDRRRDRCDRLVAAAAGTHDERDHGERDGAGHGAQSGRGGRRRGHDGGHHGAPGCHNDAPPTASRTPVIRGRARRIPPRHLAWDRAEDDAQAAPAGAPRGARRAPRGVHLPRSLAASVARDDAQREAIAAAPLQPPVALGSVMVPHSPFPGMRRGGR